MTGASTPYQQTVGTIHSDYGTILCTIRGNTFISAGGIQLYGDMAASGAYAPAPGPQNCVIEGNLIYLPTTSAPPLPEPAMPTVIPTGTGSTTWHYPIVAVSPTLQSYPSFVGSCTNSSTLNTTDYNEVIWSPVSNATSYNVYRGTTLSNIGRVANVIGATSFKDTGATLDNAPACFATPGPPTVNPMGATGVTIWAYVDVLVVPKGVTGLDFLSKNSSLAMTGDLVNYGSIYGVSGSNHTGAGAIAAANITNESGGTISTELPPSLVSSFAVGVPNSGLTLNAQNNITNSGTISSSGALTVTSVHGSIYNDAGATIVGNNNVNLNTGSGNLTNDGSIVSNNGQININSAGGRDININAQGGTFLAASGNINIGARNNQNISLVGSDLSAKQVNVSSPSGNVSFRPDRESGVVNVTAKTADVNVTNGNLELGNIKVSGDPNFSSPGNITIDGTITPTDGADMAIIAGGNIVSATSPGTYVLDTSSTSGNGGNLTLVAGANRHGTGTTSSVGLHQCGVGKCNRWLHQFSWGFGGTGRVNTITTSGSGSGNSAGYVEMIAYAGTETNSGTITLPTNVTINAVGTSSASSGDVVMIAGAPTGGTKSIVAGGISGNNITLETFTPHVPSAITFTAGTSSAGITGFTTSGNALSGTVSTQGMDALGTVTISTGSLVTLNGATGTAQINVTAGGVSIGGGLSGSSVTIDTVNNGNVLFSAGGSIVNGSTGSVTITANGSGSIVSQGGTLTSSSISFASTSGSIGSAAAPVVVNTSTLSAVTSGLVNVSSPSAGIEILNASNSSSFKLSAAGTITVEQGPTGNVINLTTAGSGTSILVNGSIGSASSTVTLKATGNGFGNISTGTQPQGVINGNIVSLFTGAGTIGTIVINGGSPPVVNITPVFVNAPTVSATTSGYLYVSDSSPVLNSVAIKGPILPLNVTQTFYPTFADISPGNISVNGTVGNSSSAITLQTTPSNGTGMISGTGTVNGNSVYLSSGSGGIFLNVNTGNLGANATSGPVSISNISTAAGFVLSASSGSSVSISYPGLGPWSTNNVSATSGSVTLSGTGNLIINGDISATGNVIINAALNGGNGNITQDGPITAGGTIGLYTSGSGQLFSLDGTSGLTASTVSLGTTSGSISGYGTSGTFVINAANLSALTTGSVAINDLNQGVTLIGANTRSSFTLYSQGTITISTGGLTSATAIGLMVQANNGGITLNDPIGGSRTTGGIGLLSNGTGLMQVPSNAAVTGSSVTLFGGSGGTYLNLNTQVIATSTSGIVSLGDLYGGTVVVGNSTASTFSLGSNGSVTLNNLAATNGYVNVLGAGALVQVVPNAAISANNGSLNLENADTSSGSIEIGAGDFIHTTGSGSTLPVNITIGAIPSNPITGPSPANVNFVFNGGTPYFGANGISVSGSGVVMSLQGSNIVFNTGSRPASAITVNANTGIIADPVRETSVPSLFMPPSEPLAQALFAGTAPSLSNFSGQSDPARYSVTRLMDTSDIMGPEVNAALPEPHVGTLFGANSGQVAALNAEDVVSVLAPIASSSEATAPTNSMNQVVFSTISNNTNSASASSMNIPSNYWISDTELVTGEIPAILNSDEDFGINSDVSMVVELSEEEQATEGGPATKPAMPLSGSVSRIVRGAREVTLRRGSVVFVPSQATIVHTSFGDVKIDARSVVLVMAFQHGLAVFDLHDTHGKAVHVVAGGKELVLAPGTQVTITSNRVKSFDEINPAQVIAYGRLRDRSLSQGLKAFTSEFSISQSLAVLLPIKQLVNSKHVHAQKLSAHLLKTAAILNQMHNGNYEQIKRQELTAYTQP